MRNKGLLEDFRRALPDREVVLYRTCPNEATSARMSLRPHRLGITRVRPLSGGFDARVEGGFPLETKTAASPLFAGS